MRILVVGALFASLVGGCANFEAVSEFSRETNKLTETLRTEFVQLDSLCAKQAELVIVVNNIQDDGPLKDCEQYQAAQGRLAGVTVDVLDNYARALAALADNKAFDLSCDLKGVASELTGLKTRDGRPLLNPTEVGALSGVVEVLLDIATSARREAAIKRLVDETPNLAVSGNVLRSFFIESPNAPAGRAKAPYANLVAIANSSIASTEASLRGPALRHAEPIRSAELYRELQVRKAMLGRRVGNSPDSIPGKVVAAIDSWQGALTKFSEEALKADPKSLRDSLKDLREKAIAARDAIHGRTN